MFRFWGANAALAELVVTSAILAATVGNINAQEAFKPYSVELLPSGGTGGLKNCSDASGCGPGPGEGDVERFAKFKKHFKKKVDEKGKADKTAKVCDVIVYGEVAGGGVPSHFVIAVTEGNNPFTIGQNGNPPRPPIPEGTKLGNVTINSVGTFLNATNKVEAKDWEIYEPIDEKSADEIVKKHKEAIDKAAKDAAAAVQEKDGKMPKETQNKWLELWRLCRNRNIALMGPDASGAGPREEKFGFRPAAPQPLGPTPSPLRPSEGYYASRFFVGAEGVANVISLGILEKDATNGVAKNGFGESSHAGGGGFIVGANTRIFSRMVLPDDASPRPVERVLLSFDFFNQDTSHVFPTSPQTFIGATSKFMITGEVQLGINVVPGVQIYGIGGFSVLNQDLNINFGGPVTTQNNTTIGPTYGAGLAFQLPGSPVTSFVQWEQTPFATTTLPRPPASSNFNYDFTNTSNRVKAGILVNFRGFSS
jgi:opacity protein-like surface antigen